LLNCVLKKFRNEEGRRLPRLVRALHNWGGPVQITKSLVTGRQSQGGANRRCRGRKETKPNRNPKKPLRQEEKRKGST